MTIVSLGPSSALRIRLCAEEIVIVTIDPRTGHLSLRDTGDLASAGRGPRFSSLVEKLNEIPDMLVDLLMRLRVIVSLLVYLLNLQCLVLICFTRL